MNIFETINIVMNDVGAIGKNSKNTTQGFMFRGVDAVMNALQPAMVKNKLFIVPEVLEQKREERLTDKNKTLIYSICKVKYTFYAEDGSSVSAIVIGEGMDTGDKATNKAMSIAFKYACFQVFCIPTEEMKDPDPESYEVEPRTVPIEERKIDSVKVRSLLAKCKADNVDILDVGKKMNVKSAADLTEKQFLWVCHNWTKEFVNGDKGKN